MGARRDHRPSGGRRGLTPQPASIGRGPTPLRQAARRSTLSGVEQSKDRVWEVFRQEAEGDPMVHGGSVRAPDEELALHYAREFYGRRQESQRLWIVARDSIVELDDADLLKPPFDRSFKRPGGYLIKHKLEAAKARAAEAAD